MTVSQKFLFPAYFRYLLYTKLPKSRPCPDTASGADHVQLTAMGMRETNAKSGYHKVSQDAEEGEPIRMYYGTTDFC